MHGDNVSKISHGTIFIINSPPMETNAFTFYLEFFSFIWFINVCINILEVRRHDHECITITRCPSQMDDTRTLSARTIQFEFKKWKDLKSTALKLVQLHQHYYLSKNEIHSIASEIVFDFGPTTIELSKNYKSSQAPCACFDNSLSMSECLCCCYFCTVPTLWLAIANSEQQFQWFGCWFATVFDDMERCPPYDCLSSFKNAVLYATQRIRGHLQ